MIRGNNTVMLALGWAMLLTVGCSETQQTAAPVAPSGSLGAGASGAQPGDPGSASDRMLFQVRLASEGDSHAAGVMQLEIVGGSLTATVHAAGLEPNQRIPQHIHVNPTCNPGGGILINLDQNLTVAGESPGTGAAFPMANQGGVINYSASRLLTDLLAAVNQYSGAGLQNTEQLIAWLDLEDRNGHMHVAFGPPFPAVNCGEVERIN
jgi:hypothetical protein